MAVICHVRGFCCLCVNSNCKPCSLISCITQVTEFDEGHRRDPIIALCIQKQNTKGEIIIESISHECAELTLLFRLLNAWLCQQVCSSRDGKPLGKGLGGGAASLGFVTLCINPHPHCGTRSI